MIPVPGFVQGTPYGARGSYWSCNSDAHGNGIHTGVDYPAPTGTKAVAARDGTVNFVNCGSAFGNHQIEVLAGDGTSDFYAHLRSSVADGTKVKAGDKVGEVGAEGNVTGPHLHFERHSYTGSGWSCSMPVNPAPSVNYQPTPPPPPEDPMPDYIRGTTTKAVKLEADKWYPIAWDDASNGSSYFNLGEPGISVKGPYSATVSVDVSGRDSGNVQVQFVEIKDGKQVESNQIDSLGPVDHGRSAQIGNVADESGRTLRARVRATNGGSLDRAEITLLAFRPK
jgi:hypothetical protein